MMLKSSLLLTLDKNGVLSVNTFHLYGGFFVKFIFFGGFMKVSVSDVSFFSLVLKKSKISGMLIHSNYNQKKNDSCTLKFKKNCCVLLKSRMSPMGFEIFGPCNFMLNSSRFMFSFSGLI